MDNILFHDLAYYKIKVINFLEDFNSFIITSSKLLFLEMKMITNLSAYLIFKKKHIIATSIPISVQSLIFLHQHWKLNDCDKKRKQKKTTGK